MEQTRRSETRDWKQAVNILSKYDPARTHLDDLLDRHPAIRLRWLLMEVFRSWHIIEHLLKKRLRRTPRPVAHAILRLAVAECLNRDEDHYPRIIHHAVETGRAFGMGKTEAGFLNGVLRGVVRSGELKQDMLKVSHPAWMTKRWKGEFGEEATEALMAWNQKESSLTLCAEECPPYAEPTSWEGYFSLVPGRFAEAKEDLASGKVYVQDPFARIPVDLLKVRAGELVLDLCAAPGGKSRLLAAALGGTGRLVLVDRPGRRIERLMENARHFEGERIETIACDLEDLAVAGPAHEVNPGSADAVLIDVPCSNTGVIRKRPDVKVRLEESSIGEMSVKQAGLLSHAAKWVRPGGRLVYSTCSIEKEENQGVIDQFLKENPGWQLATSIMSYPWECGHDGGGAFLLTNSLPV